MFRLLKISLIFLSPESHSAEDIKRARRFSTFLRYLGFVVLAIGGFFGLLSLQSSFAPPPPSTVVNAADFSDKDMTGKLNEVLIEGNLHLDEIFYATLSSDTTFLKMDFGFIPLTSDAWSTGDPINALYSSGYIKNDMTPESWKTLFLREGLPEDSKGTIKVQKLMAKREMPVFNHEDVMGALRKVNSNLSEDVVILEVIEGRREKKLKSAYRGAANLFRGFAAMGLLLLVIGWIARMSLNRVD